MKLNVNIERETASMRDLYGIFFEDLNHAADGGLYAEMVQNRSFEFDPIDRKDYHHLMGWEKIESGGKENLIIEIGGAVSEKNPHYLAIDILEPALSGEIGVRNTGFHGGMAFKKGEDYLFTCFAKREQDLKAPLKVSLRGRKQELLAEASFCVSEEWVKYECLLTASDTDTAGELAITCEGRGKVYLDFVSLFPKDTFRGRRNGLRRDLAEALEDLHPKFMRFPGGCLVHDGSLDPSARDSQYRWKNTIGPLWERPARRNNWNYNQTLGLGFYEYFLFCEDIGAKPLPILPAGYDPHHHRGAELDRLQPWIDDALDLIEFANGAADTVWGSKRAAFGHPEPFNLEYLGIGNEEVGEGFFERFDIIYREVHKRYPQIQIVGTAGPFSAGGEFERGWENARKNQIAVVDEHYYTAPEWMLANNGRYDSYPTEGPKVFLGEYATWGNSWYNALAEASYLTGLERNAGKVQLASYAPLFCNINYINWQPDMIWFDNHRLAKTVNYYVQQLFMACQGTHRIENILSDAGEDILVCGDSSRIPGELRLFANESVMEFTEITVENQDSGEIRQYPSCIVDSARDTEGIYLDTIDAVNYTISMKARELAGWKGLQLAFGRKNAENGYLWILGGWQNQDNIISERIHDRGSDLSQFQFEVEKDRVYELRLCIQGRKITASVDGEISHRTEAKPAVIKALYHAASRDEKSGKVFIKLVNLNDEAKKVEILLSGTAADSKEEGKAILTLLTGDFNAANRLGCPEMVSPAVTKFSYKDSMIPMTCPPRSVLAIEL